MYVGIHIKCPFFPSHFNGTWSFSTHFRKKSQIWIFIKIQPVGAVLFHVAIQRNKRTDRRDETNGFFLLQILQKHLKIYSYTIEGVIKRPSFKNICWFSVLNLFLILLPAAMLYVARNVIILFVSVHECTFLFLLVPWRNWYRTAWIVCTKCAQLSCIMLTLCHSWVYITINSDSPVRL